MPMMQAILVPVEVGKFELDYHLPALNGTARQVNWARLVRHRLLSRVLPKILDATADKTQDQRQEVYVRLDRLRGDMSAARWIEVHRPHQTTGKALRYVLGNVEGTNPPDKERE